MFRVNVRVNWYKVRVKIDISSSTFQARRQAIFQNFIEPMQISPSKSLAQDLLGEIMKNGKIEIDNMTRYRVFKCLWHYRDSCLGITRNMWKKRLSNVCAKEQFLILKKEFAKLPADSIYHQIYELKEELDELEGLQETLGPLVAAWQPSPKPRERPWRRSGDWCPGSTRPGTDASLTWKEKADGGSEPGEAEDDSGGVQEHLFVVQPG